MVLTKDSNLSTRLHATNFMLISNRLRQIMEKKPTQSCSREELRMNMNNAVKKALVEVGSRVVKKPSPTDRVRQIIERSTKTKTTRTAQKALIRVGNVVPKKILAEPIKLDSLFDLNHDEIQ